MAPITPKAEEASATMFGDLSASGSWVIATRTMRTSAASPTVATIAPAHSLLPLPLPPPSAMSGRASQTGGRAVNPSSVLHTPCGDLGRGLELVQLAPQGLDLVAQLGRVLEAELVGGHEHLLLELHHELLHLGGDQLLLGLRPRPARPGRDFRLERQEVGDVRDALAHGLRRDAVLLVVGDLDRAAAVGLLDRLLHRGRLLVGVHDHAALDVARGAADR